jgi:dolichol-phosphate mannosyltransferase
MHSPTSHDAPLLTVIVPVFNEAATIDELLRRVQEAPCTKQIVVVDDGSTDGTSGILCKWERESQVEVQRHDRNRGKGRAIRTGLERASGRFVIIQDGDLETDPREYARLVEPLLEGRADIVVGSRFAGGAKAPSGIDPLSRMGVRFLNFVVWLFYGVRLSDEACCYKVLPTETLRALDLRCERFEFCPEVVAKASRMGLRITEVAVSYFPRRVGSGKKIRYRDGLYALWWLWKLRKFTPRKSVCALTDLKQS